MRIEFGPKAIKFLSKSEKFDSTRIFKRIEEESFIRSFEKMKWSWFLE